MNNNNKYSKKPKGEKKDLIQKLVEVRRVTKVVKGGKNFSFSALVIVGDGRGNVGFALGKAREVGDAVSKAAAKAATKMIKVPMYEGRTLHHDVASKSGAGYVVIRGVKSGTGIIAGGAMRSVFEAAGFKDVVARSLGSNSAGSLLRSTFKALSSVHTPASIAEARGIPTSELNKRRRLYSK